MSRVAHSMTDESSLRAGSSIGPWDWILGRSPRIRELAQRAVRAAEAQCAVLISGETGTGKELWASLIHQCGPRADMPLLPVNCAALTPTLAESQLFGHEKGAFTGAVGGALGVFRAAEGGVVFLDEVGEMPLELQPKLLRVLQQNEVTPVGAARPIRVDAQLIAATNRDLRRDVADGRFREDLYYRLNMLELRLPPLRERVEDIPDLVDFFSATYARQYAMPKWVPDRDTLQAFCAYPWPGNIRQLAHVIEQAYVLQCAPALPDRDDEEQLAGPLPFLNLARLRDEALRQALRITQGHKGQAAQLLGVHANTLTRMLANLADSDGVDAVIAAAAGRPSKPR